MHGTCIHVSGSHLVTPYPNGPKPDGGKNHTRGLKLHSYGIGIPSAGQRSKWGLEFHEAANVNTNTCYYKIICSIKINKLKGDKKIQEK